MEGSPHPTPELAASGRSSDGASLPRLLAGIREGHTLGLDEHTSIHGDLPGPKRYVPSALVETIERAGLRGRGGARFPTARKMQAVASGKRQLARPLVVVNGVESEPLAAKDRLLLEAAPHLVLDGAVLAAGAVGARQIIVCVPHDALRAQRAIANALRERRDDPAAIEVAPVGGGFVASEESALVNQLNGGPAVPKFTPPRPFERGVRGRPTLIDNVETLAHVALIARHGAQWFRAIGTPAEPGSVLLTVSGAVRQPGVYEIAPGTRLPDLLHAAGGTTDAVRALLVGGYFGSFVDGADTESLVLADDWLRPHDAALGAGVVAVLPASACGAAESARIGHYLAGQSAGQCGPCVHGLADIADALAQLVDGRPGAGVVQDLGRWMGDVPGRGACKFPDGATRFMRSALRVFSNEYDDHARNGPCQACYRPAILPRPVPGDAELGAAA